MALRPSLVLLVLCCAPLVASCGSSNAPLDMGVPPDEGPFDGGLPSVGMCETCITSGQCPATADCVEFGPNRFCLLRAEDDFSLCPRTFESAVLLADPTQRYCLPTEGCCIDEDDDDYGQGEFCQGPDCDDDDAFARPNADELCNGEDDDCDEEEDESTVDCDPAQQCIEGSCVPI